MPVINNKEFSQTVEDLTNMKEGTHLHSADPGFPPNITETALQEDIDALQAARQVYEEAENQARIKYDSYNQLIKNILLKISNYSTQVYGLYGKKNQVVADFGLSPYKTGRRPSGSNAQPV